MGIKDFFLSPFRNHFHPPTIYTPFSTIKIPPISVCMFIVFCSFFIITGGFIFCIVRDVPFIGAVMGRDGRQHPSWINSGGFSQFGAEGCIIGAVFTLAGGSLVAAYSLITKRAEERKISEKNKGKQKQQQQQQSLDFDHIKELFAMSCPLWLFLSFSLFRMKIGPFIPSFTPR